MKEERITVRISESLKKVLLVVSKETGMSFSDIAIQGIIDFIVKLDINNDELNSLDYKKYLMVTKFEIQRKFHRKIRYEHLSRSLFLPRVRRDVFKLIAYKRPLKDIKKLLEVYKKEANYYTDNEDLLKELEEYTLFGESQYKQLEKMVHDRILTDEDIVNQYFLQPKKRKQITKK